MRTLFLVNFLSCRVLSLAPVFIPNAVTYLNQEIALLDKEDVKEFTLDCSDMSAYQLSKTVWDMIR